MLIDMTKVLPTEGNTTLDLLAAAIQAAPALLGVEDTAELRSVLVPIGQDQFIAYASALRVGWACDLKEPIVREAGGMILVAAPFTASEMLSKHTLAKALNGWREHGKYVNSLDFHDNVNIYRHTSYSEGWGTEPLWVCSLQENSTRSLSKRTRSGPFLHAESDFFAEDLGDACRQWLGDPGLTENSNPGIYKAIIRDRRAWLRTLKIDHDSGELSIGLDRSTKSEVFLTVITTELDGKKKVVTSKELKGTSALLPIPLPLKEIRIYLTDKSGTTYDDFRESTQYKQRVRPSILNPPPATDPEYQELREALVEGESETVEFKAWLPVDREKPKSYELLRVATAFANRFGGVIYVGVTDECEVIGTAQKLRKEFLNATAGDGDELRKQYASTLRRYLNQGISPAPASSVGWITHAGIPILRIGITSKGVLHSVVEDGAIFIRKGARDRKATPSEIEAIIGKRQPTKSGLP